MTHYDLNHAFMGCISLHHMFTFLIRRMSEYSKHEARIRLDEYMETYGSTNRIFGFDRIKMPFTDVVFLRSWALWHFLKEYQGVERYVIILSTSNALFNW